MKNIEELKSWFEDDKLYVGEYVKHKIDQLDEPETLSIDKEQLIKRIENYIPLHDKTVGDVVDGILEIVKQLPEMEVLSPDWIDENQHPYGGDYQVPSEKLEDLLVLHQAITEDQAWTLLKEKYEWPWVDLRYTVMQQLEEGTAEAKMTNLGYFEVEVDGVKYHVHEDAHSRIYDEAYEQGRSDLERELRSDLPVIPKFVADYIDDRKEASFPLYQAIRIVRENSRFEHSHLREWLWTNKGQETFAKAWLDGYQVEEEQKYRVMSKNVTLLGKINGMMLTTAEMLNYYPEYKPTYELTEKEIKDYDPRYWAFAKPVMPF